MKTAMILVAGAALLAATTASAQMGATTTKPTTPVTKPKAAMSGSPVLKTVPAAKPAPAMKAAKATPVAGSGRMVSTTTKTGKKVTYDCSKKGNMTKTACKG